MLKRVESQKELFSVTFVLALLFYLLAHGHRFTNSMFSGDSLYMVYQNDSAWQIALGRFMQPFLVFLRGGIVSPFLISVICVCFLGLSAYFLVDFLEIKRVLSIALVVAVMTCNATVLAANATFLHSSDFYAIALFLSVFGVWLMKKEKVPASILGILALSVSLGIYQSYICVSIALVMIHFIFVAIKKPALGTMIKSLAKYLLCFMVSAIFYYAVWKIFQRVFHIWTADTYNGLASVGDYSAVSFMEAIALTYRNVFAYFVNPDTFITMPFRGMSLSIFWVYILRFCNVAVLVVLVAALLIKNGKCRTKPWQWMLQLLILLLFPLGINFVCFISKGMEHTPMIYAFCMVYVLAIKAAESCMPVSAEEKLPVQGKVLHKMSVPSMVVLAAVLILSWSNVVYANQVYLKKDLQDKAALSLMTRITYEIEEMEGYVVGETPVAFYGSFEGDSCVSEMEAFQEIKPYGMGKSSLTYVGTDYAYLTYILNVNMNLTRVSDENGVIERMPVYPAEGSVAYVGDTIVVKISEVK